MVAQCLMSVASSCLWAPFPAREPISFDGCGGQMVTRTVCLQTARGNTSETMSPNSKRETTVVEEKTEGIRRDTK